MYVSMRGVMLSTVFVNLHLNMNLCISLFLETRFLWGKTYEDVGHWKLDKARESPRVEELMALRTNFVLIIAFSEANFSLDSQVSEPTV